MSKDDNLYQAILQKYFGYASFRGIQENIVRSIGEGKDTLGLMPTGGGKSIAFQVPALAMDGVCIVITPLIALMKDQVQHLHDKGILAACVNSSMTYREILQVYDNAIYGGVKFLYVSPERLATSLFINKVQHMKICFIAVDEAHCICQWGYDFRPSYLQISKIRELLPDIPILALTATATPAVVEDIQEQLRFREKRVFKMSFKRENLVYVVRSTADKYRELVHILNSLGGAAIVYTRSRQNTKDIARRLAADGIPATYYHAGLDFAVKDQRQMEWQMDKTRVMVATNAFGMGIDKPNVRLVIHLDCPDSVEAYFQEAGRAGRDGLRAYAVLLHNREDNRALMRHLLEAFPPKEYLRKVYDHLAYYFQLAVDSGEGASYEFDIKRFCRTFNHYPATLENALAILQRAGYIDYDPDPDNHPRVQFLLLRHQLYRLNELSEGEESIITALLRCYGNLFSDLGYVEIGELSLLTGISEEQVHTILKSLARMHIIRYIPRHYVPRISYPMQRVDSDKLVFPKRVYEFLINRMRERLNGIMDYANATDRCRSVMLLDYFGEKSGSCGCCDVCLSNKNNGAEAKKTIDAASAIIEQLKNVGSLPAAALMELPYPRKELFEAVDKLRAENQIIVDGSHVSLSDD